MNYLKCMILNCIENSGIPIFYFQTSHFSELLFFSRFSNVALTKQLIFTRTGLSIRQALVTSTETSGLEMKTLLPDKSEELQTSL